MKKVSLRKAVLYSISLFASIMLFVGLAFKVLAYDLGLGDTVGSAMSQVGMTANGFDMFSFSFPAVLEKMVAVYVDADFLDLCGVMLGVTSILTLVVSLCSIGFAIFAFFKMEEKKGEKTLKTFLFISLFVVIVYSVFSIIVTVSAQSGLKETYDKLSGITGSATTQLDSYKTSAYLSLIFQIVCLVAYMICSVKIKRVEVVKEVKTTEAGSGVVAKDVGVSAEQKLESLLSAEQSIIDLLGEYKVLYDDAVIASADYMDKKVKLIKSSEKRIKQGLAGIMNKVPFEGLVKAEVIVTKLLREYKKLLEKGVISDADYVEKKVALLSYIIN